MSADGFVGELKVRLAWYEQQAQAVRQLLAGEGQPSGFGQRRQDFAGLGIVQATERLLRETSRPMSTTEITGQLLARGVTTKSKRYVPTVYATLDNSSLFERVGIGRAGRWTLSARTSDAQTTGGKL
jgi:hypothetical protein